MHYKRGRETNPSDLRIIDRRSIVYGLWARPNMDGMMLVILVTYTIVLQRIDFTVASKAVIERVEPKGRPTSVCARHPCVYFEVAVLTGEAFSL